MDLISQDETDDKMIDKILEAVEQIVQSRRNESLDGPPLSKRLPYSFEVFSSSIAMATEPSNPSRTRGAFDVNVVKPQAA